MNTTDARLTLVALDEVDAVAWGAQYPELSDAVMVVLIDEIAKVELHSVSAVVFTQSVVRLGDAASPQLLRWLGAFVNTLIDGDGI